MSLTKGKRIQCDFCGKLTRNRQGEYTRPDGSAGHMSDSKVRESLFHCMWGCCLDCCNDCNPTARDVAEKIVRLKKCGAAVEAASFLRATKGLPMAEMVSMVLTDENMQQLADLRARAEADPCDYKKVQAAKRKGVILSQEEHRRIILSPLGVAFFLQQNAKGDWYRHLIVWADDKPIGTVPQPQTVEAIGVLLGMTGRVQGWIMDYEQSQKHVYVHALQSKNRPGASQIAIVQSRGEVNGAAKQEAHETRPDA